MGKLLYRVDEVMFKLAMSRRTVYRLLENGKLIGHNDSPGKKGLRITVVSVDAYYIENLQDKS